MQTPLLVTCFPELQTNLKRSSERKSLSIPSLSNNSSLVVIRFSRSCFFSNWSGYSPYRSWYSCITKQNNFPNLQKIRQHWIIANWFTQYQCFQQSHFCCLAKTVTRLKSRKSHKIYIYSKNIKKKLCSMTDSF